MSRNILFLFAIFPLLLSTMNAAKVGEAAGEIGTILELGNGQRLQIFVEDKQVHAFFVDAEGKVVESNGDSIVLVIEDPGHKNDKWRALLQPAGEQGFTSSRRLFAPYEFRSHIIIRFTDADPISFSKKAIDLDKMVGQSVADDI